LLEQYLSKIEQRFFKKGFACLHVLAMIHMFGNKFLTCGRCVVHWRP